MRVLFVSLPERSHVYCMTPLAWAMAAAGHEVRMATSPMATGLVTGAGLTAVPVGPEHDVHQGMAGNRDSQDSEFSDWNDPGPDGMTWENVLLRYQISVRYGFAVYNDPMIDDLVAFARHWRPGLVVWDPLAYAGGLAAKAVGAAHARYMCWADVWGAMRATFLRLRGDRTDDPLGDWLGERAAAHGFGFTEDLVVGEATVDPLPASLGVPTGSARVPVRHVPYNGRAVVEGWLREPPARPRVCLTLGTSNSERYGGDFVPVADIVAAVAELDVEVVAALVPRQRAELGAVPPNVRVVEFLALHTVLDGCSAVIHHGGFGSFAAALVAGVPQLVVTTRISDHVLRARRLADAGAGLYLASGGLRPEAVRDAVARLVDEPGFAKGAAAARAEALAHPAPSEIVGRLTGA